MIDTTSVNNLDKLKERIGLFTMGIVALCSPIIPFIIPENHLLPTWTFGFSITLGIICAAFLILVLTIPKLRQNIYYFIVATVTVGIYSCLFYAYWFDLLERDAGAVIYFSMISILHFNNIRDLIIFYIVIFIGVLFVAFNVNNPHINASYFIVRFVVFNLIAIGFFSVYMKTLTSFIQREYRYTQLFQMMNEGVLHVDNDERVISANQQFCEMTGYSEKELIGKVASQILLFPEEQPILEQKTEDRKQKKSDNYEIKIKHKSGEPRWVRISASPVYNEKQEVVGSFGIQIDITERVKAEQALREYTDKLEATNAELDRSNKELQQFAYVASHDLKSPLRTIASFARLLKRRYSNQLDQTADDFIYFIVTGCEKMNVLINDLLAYSRSGIEQVKKQPLDLKELIDDVHFNLNDLITKNEATIVVNDLPEIQGDKTQITQLFQNLIENAIKYRNGQPPLIKIDFDQKKKYFSVEDNGIGINPLYFEKIFKIFHRLNPKDASSSGIGLAICKKITENHGGKIWLESEEGKGTTFYFTLN